MANPTRLRACVVCGSEFVAHRASSHMRRKTGDQFRQTCSRECGVKNRRPTERFCGFCDSPSGSKKYCSDLCWATDGAASRIAYCGECGVVIPGHRKFCGERCRLARWRKPPRVFKLRSCRWCAGVYQPVSANQIGCNRQHTKYLAKERRRMLKLEAFIEDIDRSKVYKRDQWICGLCGDPVDRDASVPDHLAPTLDHIRPLSKGGDHSYENVQTAHFICNSRKGDRWDGFGRVVARVDISDLFEGLAA